MAIGRAVMSYARAANEFSTEIKCRHCTVVSVPVRYIAVIGTVDGLSDFQGKLNVFALRQFISHHNTPKLHINDNSYK